MATTGFKCKRTAPSIEKKIEVLDKLKNNSSAQLARDYRVGISFVYDHRKTENMIHCCCCFTSMDSLDISMKSKVIRKAKDEALDNSGKI